MTLDTKTRESLEAAAFRRLITHLQAHTEVQNIELMILADFCRNCMSKWMVSAAEEQGIALDYDQAREHVYGMPYGDWKKLHQRPASPEQLAALKDRAKPGV
jgi:hypothetical protein